MDGKGFVGGIPGSCSLQAAYVGSMSELGLGITSDDLIFLRLLEEELMLFRRALITKSNLVKVINKCFCTR